MTTPTDDRSPKLPRGWLRATVVSTIAFAFVAAAAGFVAFLSQLRGAEIAPGRKADGIVVLTGGSSRVSDAMELLAAGYGRRLLISGVHPTSTANDISRTLPENQSFMTCCVDLDRERHLPDPPGEPVLHDLLRRSRPYRAHDPRQRG